MKVSTPMVNTSIGLLITILVIAICLINPLLGIYPFGPEGSVVAEVNRTYVDVSGSKDSTKSHYMVATDKGVYEVDNSLWLWFWTADEVYGKIKAGKSYRFKTKGNKVVGFFFQEYSYILQAEEVTPVLFMVEGK